MDVRILALTEDPAVVALLHRVLDNMGVELEVRDDVEDFHVALSSERFEGVVIDADNVKGAMPLISELRRDSRCRTTVIFTIIAGRTSLTDAFDMGSTFVLQKPLAMERAMRCFRAAYGIIIGERRRYFRHTVGIPMEIEINGGRSVAKSLDISAGGISFESSATFVSGSQLKLHMELPGAKLPVDASCEIVWVSEHRAGLRFLNMAPKARVALSRWLDSRLRTEPPKQPTQVAARVM